MNYFEDDWRICDHSNYLVNGDFWICEIDGQYELAERDLFKGFIEIDRFDSEEEAKQGCIDYVNKKTGFFEGSNVPAKSFVEEHTAKDWREGL